MKFARIFLVVKVISWICSGAVVVALRAEDASANQAASSEIHEPDDDDDDAETKMFEVKKDCTEADKYYAEQFDSFAYHDVFSVHIEQFQLQTQPLQKSLNMSTHMHR